MHKVRHIRVNSLQNVISVSPQSLIHLELRSSHVPASSLLLDLVPSRPVCHPEVGVTPRTRILLFVSHFLTSRHVNWVKLNKLTRRITHASGVPLEQCDS